MTPPDEDSKDTSWPTQVAWSVDVGKGWDAMRMIAALVLTALALLGCGSSEHELASGSVPSDSGSGICAHRSGNYVKRYTVRSGDCGEGAETVTTIDTQPSTVGSPWCSGSTSYTPDNCEVTYSATCPNDAHGRGGELSITGKSKWSTDGATGSAVEEWVLRDSTGTTLCQGTYDVTLTRQ